jgi:hypothetical protein
MSALFLVTAYLLAELTKEERKLIPRMLLRGYRLQAYGSLAAAALFLISTIPVFWTFEVLGVPIRFILWMGTFFVMVVRRGVERMSMGADSAQAVAEAGIVGS